MTIHYTVAICALILGLLIGFIVGVNVGLRTAFRAVRQPASALSAVLCSICAAVALLAAMATSLYSAYFLVGSQSTKATVIDVRDRKDSEGNVSRFPVYRYKDASGAEHRGTSFSSDGTDYVIGDVLPVRYLRNSPADARIDHFSHHWLLPILLAGFSAVAFVISAALHRDYKQQKSPAAAIGE